MSKREKIVKIYNAKMGLPRGVHCKLTTINQHSDDWSQYAEEFSFATVYRKRKRLCRIPVQLDPNIYCGANYIVIDSYTQLNIFNLNTGKRTLYEGCKFNINDIQLTDKVTLTITNWGESSPHTVELNP